jgi:two-component system, OmpR family, response regulator ResD
MSLDGLKLDYTNYRLVSGSAVQVLTSTEARLLGILMINTPRTVSREALVAKAWETQYTVDSKLLGPHISSLRKKLITNRVWKIETVWGLGYRLVRLK